MVRRMKKNHVEEISQQQVPSLASKVEPRALLALQQLGYRDSVACALAVCGKERPSYQEAVVVSHCDEEKTTVGNRGFCKLPKRKKSVKIGCK